VCCSNCDKESPIINKKYNLCYPCNFQRTHKGVSIYEHQHQKQQEYTKKQQQRAIERLATTVPTEREKRKSVSKVSSKRQKQLATYSKERIHFLDHHHVCQANLVGCTGFATEVHHQQGKENELLLEQDKWLAICRPCHTWITENSGAAICMGLSLRRNAAVE
jgi:hypothetical protein